MDELILSILDSYQPSVKDQNIVISTNVKEGDQIQSAHGFVESIVKHLLGNSIKFRQSSKKTKISLNFSEDDTHYIISVRDNGIDLEKDENRRFIIYEKRGGRGLGLYLVKNHINALGGHVEVISKPNKSSEFIVSLPKSLDKE